MHTSSMSKSSGLITVLLTLAGWSAVPLFLRYFADHIDAWTSNGWRYSFAALCWAPVVVAKLFKKDMPPKIWKLAIIPALVNSIGQVCFTVAHYKINPGLLTFGLRSQIVFVTIGAAILFANERAIIRSPRFLFGLFLVMAGTTGAVLFGEPLQGATGVGVILALSSGVAFAAYALSVRHYMHGVNPIVAFAVISQYTALTQLGLMFALGDRFGAGALDLSTLNLAALLFSAVIGIALGHVFYYISIAKLGVAVSSGVIQLQPICVGILSYFIFKEQLSAGQWTSGAFAIIGAALMLYVQHRMTRSRPDEPIEKDIPHFEDLPIDVVTAAAAGEGVGERELTTEHTEAHREDG